MRPPLTMRCTVARGTAGTGTLGHTMTFATQATSVPCYWWGVTPIRTADADVPGVVAMETERLIVARGTDIEQGDRITALTDHLGSSVFSSTDYRTVEHVISERTHLVCVLRMAKIVGGRT